MNFGFNFKNKIVSLGFNTKGHNQSYGRTSDTVALGRLGSSAGSISRKFNYCNKNSPDLSVTFKCVFDIPLCFYYQLDSSWATFRGNNPNFYGQSLFNGPTNLNIKYYTNNSDFNVSTSTCVIDDKNNIYVCGTSKSYLYCFNPDCSLKWFFDTKSVITSPNPSGCWASFPTIGCDGTIYFACYMYVDVNGDFSKLFAINPNGTEKWNVDLFGKIDDSIAIIGPKQNIFAATGAGYNYVINQNGKIENIYKFTNDSFNGWNISVDSDTKLVFINSSNNYLYRIDVINNVVSKVLLPSNGLYSIPIVIGNSVYQGTETGIYKYNKNTLELEDSQTGYGGMYNNSPSVDKNGYIYIGTDQRIFIKLDKNLNHIWTFDPGNNPEFNIASSIISNNNIYINDSNNNILYCLNTNGEFISSIQYNLVQPNSYSTPAIGQNGLIYINTQKGLLAIGE